MRFTKERVIKELDEIIFDLNRSTSNPIIQEKLRSQIGIL